MALPLDQTVISLSPDNSRKEEKIPALHPRWVENIQFVVYQPAPTDRSDLAAMEEWLERLSFIEDDLHTLLKLPHGKFWCQVVFDENLQRCLDSYLRLSPRPHDLTHSLHSELPVEARAKSDMIHKLVFLTYLRMATHKESKDHFLTPHVFGEILYENFLFDIPKIMDLCMLYGASNGPLLSKMIGNIFTQQPKYNDDLRAVVPTVLQVFENICTKCGIKLGSLLSSPQKLGQGNSKLVSLVEMPIAQLQDLIFYLCDIANTLWAFLEVYPAAAVIFAEADFPIRLVCMYESIVMGFSDAFTTRDWDSTSVKSNLKRKVHESQLCLLKVFRQMIYQSYLEPVLESRSPENLELYIEGYLHTMSAILAERRFLAHSESLYAFADDEDILLQSPYAIDETRLEFIKEGIQDAFSVYGKKKQKRQKKAVVAKSSPEGVATEGAEAGASYQTENYEELGACAPQVAGIELDSLISMVHDLLPDLGEGFIELCLEEYNYDTETVINLVLEDKLPPSLHDIDRKLNRVKPPGPEDEAPLMAERRNIYDNDEFDIFSQDKVDTSKIHMGKKEKVVMMEDRQTRDQLRPLYDKYGNEDMESLYDKLYEYEDAYDDEYDDTYDTNMVGADDADSADELLARKLRNVPRILGIIQAEEGTEDSAESEEESRPRDQFVEDPAVLRAKQAERRASQDSRRHKGGQGQRGPPQGQQKTHDVVGNAKGQGQTSEVKRNRAWKEKHKSTKGPHNRRALADKKRQF